MEALLPHRWLKTCTSGHQAHSYFANHLSDRVFYRLRIGTRIGSVMVMVGGAICGYCATGKFMIPDRLQAS